MAKVEYPDINDVLFMLHFSRIENRDISETTNESNYSAFINRYKSFIAEI